MAIFLAVGVFLTFFISGVFGQSCNSNLPSECFYTGAGTISAGSASVNNYFAIGGLFDIHEHGTDSYCGQSVSKDGLVNLLAFYWSVDRFSKIILRQKSMTVGAVSFDSCMRPDQTVENVLSFSNCKVQVQGLRHQNLVGYVGPYTNKDAERMAMLAKDLKISLISPDANSLEIKENENLLQLRPNMESDVKAILAFLKSYQVKNALIIHSVSPFWKQVYSMMKNLAGSDVCVAYHAGLSEDATDDEIDKVVEKMVALSRSKFIVPLMSKDLTLRLIKKTLKASNADFTYLLNSDIGRDSDIVANHAIIVEQSPPSSNHLIDFSAYLKTVRANSSLVASLSNDPFLQDYLKTGGKFPDLMNSASKRLAMKVMRTITSVKIFVQAVDKGISTTCGTGNDYQFCDDLRNIAGKESSLFKSIMNEFQTNSLEDEYTYYLYTNQDNTFHKVGTYKIRNGAFNPTKDIAYSFGASFFDSMCDLDHSSCCIAPTSPPPSTTQKMTTIQTTSTAKPTGAMVRYPEGKYITGAYMDEDHTETRTRFDLDQKWVIALGVLAGFGILCVLVFEIFILYKMMGKRVSNKWRTMWLGQLLLLGIFLAYLVCFAYLFIPTKATCGITRFGVGLAYAVCFAVLLVKLMVILTSKTSEALLPGDVESPNYLKGVYQALMFLFAVGVQIVINVQWLITVPPDAVKVISNNGDKVWVCNHYTWEAGKTMDDMGDFVRTNFENHVLSLTYIMFLIVIITVLSLNAHGIITNHRESVFIGLASGFSIPLWLAWGLIGALNKDNDFGHEFGDACMAFGLLLTATLLLFTMFLPKVRQLVNMGVEGIYLEDDRDTIYGGSIIMGPPSLKGKGGQNSVIYVNNHGIYSEPVVVGNGDTKLATHLKHPGSSTYSAPPTYLKKSDSTYGGSRVLRVTDDLKGRHPTSKPRKPLSETGYNTTSSRRSHKGTPPRSNSSDLGAL